MLNNRKKGFTLIELLVVIAIIGMLAATVLVSMGTARSKGRDAKRIADLKNLELAIQLYSDSNKGRVPNALSELVTGQYIKVEPKDPNTDSKYGYTAFKKVAGTDKCLKYHLGAVLENRNQVHEADADETAEKAPKECGEGIAFDGDDGTVDTPIKNKCGMTGVDDGHCYDLTN
ncbi:MAG: Type IV pilin PilA-like protein [Candidatus Nomurabacteria bacterium GW2011_GWF2_35_66]|nr:MAG: Type IV pilin PilA-like protein [Candidatus Nomurabacteria bacterium GW2011_GWF2_35_66]HBM45420.1 hypothetical protein [Patescibacteria group bacterium]